MALQTDAAADGVGFEERAAGGMLNAQCAIFDVQLNIQHYISSIIVTDASRFTSHESLDGLLSILLVAGADGTGKGSVFLARLVRTDYIGHIQEHMEVYS